MIYKKPFLLLLLTLFVMNPYTSLSAAIDDEAYELYDEEHERQSIAMVISIVITVFCIAVFAHNTQKERALYKKLTEKQDRIYTKQISEYRNLFIMRKDVTRLTYEELGWQCNILNKELRETQETLQKTQEELEDLNEALAMSYGLIE